MIETSAIINFHLKLHLKPKFNSSKKFPYVFIREPFAAKSDRLVAVFMLFTKTFG